MSRPTPTLVYRRAATRWEQLEDRELLDRLRGGSEAALGELVRRKSGPLLQAVQRILGSPQEAEDVVQIAFLRVWEHRARYDRRWSPNTWIYRIATNLAIDHLRARRSRERQHEPYRVHLRQVRPAGGNGGPEQLQDGEVQRIFEEISTRLTDKQRAAFVLRELEGLTSPEVARILGCRESTVRNHVLNARRTLQEEVRRRFPEYFPGAP